MDYRREIFATISKKIHIQINTHLSKSTIVCTKIMHSFSSNSQILEWMKTNQKYRYWINNLWKFKDLGVDQQQW